MLEPLHLQDVFMSRPKAPATQALFSGTWLISRWIRMKRWATSGC